MDSGVGNYRQSLEIHEGDVSTIPIHTGAFARSQEGKIGTRFRGIKTMGTGAYGTVLAIEPRAIDSRAGEEANEDGKSRYACKCMNKGTLDKTELEQMYQEIELLKKCDHPNIIKFYAHYEDQKQIFLVQELCEGGELFDLITNPSFYKNASKVSRERNAAVILKQLLSGVAYLHQMGIVHRDMKPENVLLKNPGDMTNIKIIDFGLSAKWKVGPDGESLHEQVGTPYYIAPEVLEKHYGPKCDVWSLGVILYVLICGQAPFWGSDDRTILRKVREKKFAMQGDIWNQATPELKDLITKMLTYPPQNRIGAKEALKHPWFKIALAEEAPGRALSPSVVLPSSRSDEAAWKNLRKLHGYNRLQSAIRLCIGYHANKDSDIKALTSIFKKMDTDGNGILDKQEFIQSYSEYKKTVEPDTAANGGVIMDDVYQQEAEEAFRKMDLNNDGYIAISEWLAATLDDEYMQKHERLLDAFNVFDIDGNGRIDINELLNILGLGENTQDVVARQTLKSYIEKCDVNHDGFIDFEEFTRILGESVIVHQLSS